MVQPTSLVQPSAAWNYIIQPGYSLVQPSTAYYSQVQPETAKYSLVKPGTAMFSRLQPCRSKYCLEQPSTAWYSLVQPSAAWWSFYDLDDSDYLDDLDRYLDTCFGLCWSTLIYLSLLGLFQIAMERLKCSKAISGIDGMGLGLEISVCIDSAVLIREKGKIVWR